MKTYLERQNECGIKVLEKVTDNQKQWPDKFILICRTEEEFSLAKEKIGHSSDFKDKKVPYAIRLSSNSYAGHATIADYENMIKEGHIPGYVSIEASEYFGLNKKEISSVADSKKVETQSQKGNTMVYQVVITKSAVERVKEGHLDAEIILPITTIEAPSAVVAVAIAAQGLGNHLNEFDRLNVSVKEF